jgi:ubiquinone/menaquinone biosynthesis C-methylase UbiE
MLNSTEIEMLPFKARGLSEMVRFLGDIEFIINNSKKQNFKVLEIGCGFGQVMIDLLNLYGERLIIYGINRYEFDGNLDTAIRVSKHIGSLTKKATSNLNNIKFIYCDAGESLPFDDNTFDFVLSQMAILYIEDKIKLIEEVSRVLKADGTALLHTAFKRNIYKAELNSSLDLYHNNKIIDTETYLSEFASVSFLDRHRGKILKLDGGRNLDFKLQLDSVTHLEKIDKSFFGVKSKYNIIN